MCAAQLGELHIQSPNLNVVLGFGGLLDSTKSCVWVTGMLYGAWAARVRLWRSGVDRDMRSGWWSMVFLAPGFGPMSTRQSLSRGSRSTSRAGRTVMEDMESERKANASSCVRNMSQQQSGSAPASMAVHTDRGGATGSAYLSKE